MTGLRNSTFRERFTELFEESGKTVVELAKELHVSYQAISAWKTGARSPKEPTVVAIAKYFKVRVEWLMGFDVEKDAPHGDAPIVVPDTAMFRKIMEYMSVADYEMVMEAFDRTYKKMKEMGVV